MKRKRSSITLLEIMIVILLVGIIGGVLSYNLKGSLDKGKKFRTSQGIKRLKEILEIELEQSQFNLSMLANKNQQEIQAEVKKIVESSGLIAPNKIDEFLKDGWKQPYQFQIKENQFIIVSPTLPNLEESNEGLPIPKS